MAKEIKITLAAARVNKGYSQKEAGAKIGVSEYTIQNIEIGRTDPRFSTIVKLSELYEIPIDNLILPEKSA